MGTISDDQEPRMTLEELQQVLHSIDTTMKSLADSGINPEALINMICDSAPRVKQHGKPPRKLKSAEVKAVLNGLESLKEYLFPTKIK